MAQTAEKAGSGEEKSECLVLAQKAELFTEPGSVSGNREERFLPAFPIYHICPSEGVGGQSGVGAPPSSVFPPDLSPLYGCAKRRGRMGAPPSSVFPPDLSPLHDCAKRRGRVGAPPSSVFPPDLSPLY